MAQIMLITLFVIASVLSMGESSPGQTPPIRASIKGDLAQIPLENVLIEEESLAQFFSHLSFAYNIPIGLEIGLGGDEQSVYRIELKKGTLADLLTQFVAEHKAYTWKIENGVVSVFPKDAYRDPVLRQLLATQIRSFSITEETDVWSFGKQLLSVPEVKRILERYGMTGDPGYLGGFYIQQLGRKFSFEVSNVQLKAILDKVIKESPVARNWSVRCNIC